MKPKEFFSRWKQGIQQITPLQQQRISLIGGFIVICGILIGIVTAILVRVWWLLVILCGSLFLTGMSLVSTLQKYFAFKEINKQMKGGENGI